LNSTLGLVPEDRAQRYAECLLAGVVLNVGGRLDSADDRDCGARFACAIILAMIPSDHDLLKASPLPPDFVFSQSSLQAFHDCPRRFWLTYIEAVPWPALEAIPVQEYERNLRLGATFHRLVERAESGIDENLVGVDLENPLSQWYSAYQNHRPRDLPVEHLEIERTLAIPLLPMPANPSESTGEDAEGYQGKPLNRSDLPSYFLAAKYDLIAAEKDGPVVIIDWKTNRSRSQPSHLAQRLQTAVYPFVLAEASSALAWGPVKPKQIEMRYWFVAEPTQPVCFQYDTQRHEANRERLRSLIAHIVSGQSEPDYPKVPDTEGNRKRLCAYCSFRSRCNRGVHPGILSDIGPDLELELPATESLPGFTLEDIDELSF
jgi:CRISPR/Cas system-associated exonuclease Cas4 (RecB family)